MFSEAENFREAAPIPLSSTVNNQGEEKYNEGESLIADSNDFTVRVKDLSKRYQIYDTPRNRLKQFIVPRLQRLAGQPPKQYFREFWALRDVSFHIRKGETVGIVGRNGSGKSTLLQIICGTTSPTSGDTETRGRIAALLELGAGFNPEFTGRENIYMNAAVLGLSRDEAEARFGSIEAFADIGGFIDQPVKSYSSGMVVRLAFSVAINVDPQILVVDEALSVGDELFQRKCFSRIEAIKKSGTTILFVSHSGSTIVELCDRAILLDKGEMLTSGPPKTIIAKYQRLLYAPESKREDIRDEIKLAAAQAGFGLTLRLTQPHATKSKASVRLSDIQEFFDPHLKAQSTIAYEPRGAIIEEPEIFSLAGDPLNCLKRGQIYCFRYKVRFNIHASNVRFGMLIKTTSGVELGGATSATAINEGVAYIQANMVYQVEFRFRCALNPGTYYLNAGVEGIQANEEMYLHRLLDAIVFKVLPGEENFATGIVDFSCEPTSEPLPTHTRSQADDL